MGLIEKAHGIKGAQKVVADLVKGHNWFKGAEWVLVWIDAKGLWKQVKAFEKVGKNRFWDAHIGEKLYQFKSWLKFHRTTFVSQFDKDIKLKGPRLVVWVFEKTEDITDVASVRKAMRAAIEASNLHPTRKSKLVLDVDLIEVHVDEIARSFK